MSASKTIQITDSHNVVKNGNMFIVYNDDEEFGVPANARFVEKFNSAAYRKADPLHLSYVPDTDLVKMLSKGNIVKEFDTDAFLVKSYVINDKSFKESAGIAAVPHNAERDAMAATKASVTGNDDVIIFDKDNNKCVQRMTSSAHVTTVNAWQASGSGTTAMIATDSNTLTEFFDTRSNQCVFMISGENMTLPVQDSNFVYSIRRSGKNYYLRRLELNKNSKGEVDSKYQMSSFDRKGLPPTPRGLYGNEKRMLYVYTSNDDVWNIRHYDMCTPTTKDRSFYVELDMGASGAKVLSCAVFDNVIYVVTDLFITMYSTVDVDNANAIKDGTLVKPMMPPIVYEFDDTPEKAVMITPDNVYLIFKDSTMFIFELDATYNSNSAIGRYS